MLNNPRAAPASLPVQADRPTFAFASYPIMPAPMSNPEDDNVGKAAEIRSSPIVSIDYEKINLWVALGGQFEAIEP
jgi:hypothetical protein